MAIPMPWLVRCFPPGQVYKEGLALPEPPTHKPWYLAHLPISIRAAFAVDAPAGFVELVVPKVDEMAAAIAIDKWATVQVDPETEIVLTGSWRDVGDSFRVTAYGSFSETLCREVHHARGQAFTMEDVRAIDDAISKRLTGG